ncbi:arylamine N-acetyltransferase [Saccharothrix sp. S26]|uniref:arylamine N-acetyltransferase family protein n=1 Tax=Saccharothrix sp. S26 TaxID=2907215 RepID=UPI001F463B2E|nr:arylamine N-acetyltransferase [Saccharothrix sp. S26]MCE6996380.1 arylamine N-acetyltransferase [Saccharothrix sp. S26]
MRTEDQWESDRLDVDTYLDRLGITGPLAPTAQNLRRLHRAHVLTIPFENLDVVLGRGVDLDVPAMQAKLLENRRGGYCYEHNMLLAALLDRLGYRVTRLFARPDLHYGKPLPRTHMALRVEVEDGTAYLADVGFGDSGPLDPVPFGDVVSEQAGWTYRLAEERDRPQPWCLYLKRDDGWFPVYRFSLEAHHRIDCLVANHFISTNPRSPFVGRVFLERIAEHWRLNLNNRVLTLRHADGRREESRVEDDGFAEVLADRFGVVLSEPELKSVLAALPD